MKIWSLILLTLSVYLASHADQNSTALCPNKPFEYAFLNNENENNELIVEIEKRLTVSSCFHLLRPDIPNYEKSLKILEYLGGKIYDLKKLKEDINETDQESLADKIANQIFMDALGINPHFEYEVYYTVNNGKRQELRKQKLWQSKEESELLYTSNGVLISLSVSPDGNYLLFQDRTNKNEGRELTIYDHHKNRFGKIQFSNGMVQSRASFHPNCDLLSFSYRSKKQTSKLEQGIYQLDLKSNRTIPTELFDEAGIDMEPEYSPEGELYFISDHYNNHRWSPHVKVIPNFSRVASDLWGKEFYEQRAPRISVDGKYIAVNQAVSITRNGKATRLSSIGIFEIESSKIIELSIETLHLFDNSQDLQWIDSANISFLKSDDFKNTYTTYNLGTDQYFEWSSLQNIRKATRMFPINQKAQCDLNSFFQQ
ncbi:MAG: hypothetical protein VX642_15275 [Bdellovibrionota bacterium]|nr:hypothetical protein [Bdellovibrionota bacterium]